MSVILFLIVFNILLELLAVLCSQVGYEPSFSDSKTSKKAFADDLTLLTKSEKEMKKMLNVVEEFLDWLKKMKAKPSKCLSMSMKCTGGKYNTYDAEFVLSNQQVPSIIQAPMKFLGMYMYVYLELKEIRFMIKKKLEDLLETTSKDEITGPIEAWVYNRLIKMSWGFTV